MSADKWMDIGLLILLLALLIWQILGVVRFDRRWERERRSRAVFRAMSWLDLDSEHKRA